MKFVSAIWKLLVGVKDALVLLLLIIFFAGMYGALSARPAAVKEGVLDLNLNGSVVEQPSRREWADVAGSGRTQEYRLRDLVAALDNQLFGCGRGHHRGEVSSRTSRSTSRARRATEAIRALNRMTIKNRITRTMASSRT